jgi:hypothetical protein
MRLDQEKRPTRGCLLMSCTQNFSFPPGTTFVKHILLLVAWQKLLAATFLIEFQDPKKATSDYLSSISGIRSWAMVSDEDKLASQGKDATTSISESVHASSTVGLGIAGTICLDHVTAEGQTRSNNDFGCGHE